MSAEPGAQRPNYKWLVAAIVGSGVFMSTLSQGSLNVAMPTIAREFGVDLTTVQWLSLGYGLGMTSLLLSMARLADIVGRRRMYLIGYTIFGAGAVLCSVMPDVYMIKNRSSGSTAAARAAKVPSVIVTPSFRHLFQDVVPSCS